MAARSFLSLRLTQQTRRKRFAGLPPHARGSVAVDPESDADIRVAGELLDDLRLNAGRKHEGTCRVPQVMQADPR